VSGTFCLSAICRAAMVAALVFGPVSMSRAQEAAAPVSEIRIGYIHAPHSKLRLSLLDMPADNDGLAGLQLAMDDSNTTGQFQNQSFVLVNTLVKTPEDVAAAMAALAGQKVGFVVTDLDADALLKAAEIGKANGQVLFNASAPDERLREEDCRANVIHVAPSRAQLADGLAQYLIWKNGANGCW